MIKVSIKPEEPDTKACFTTWTELDFKPLKNEKDVLAFSKVIAPFIDWDEQAEEVTTLEVEFWVRDNDDNPIVVLFEKE